MQKVRKLIWNHCFKNCWTDDITWTNWFRNFLKKRCTQFKIIHPPYGGESLPFFHMFHWSSLFPAFVKDWTPVHVHLVDWELLESRESPALFPVGKLPQQIRKLQKIDRVKWGKLSQIVLILLMIYIPGTTEQPVLNGCLFKQPFPHLKIWNHPTETTIYKQMFQVPGVYSIHIIENEWFDFWDILMLKSLRLAPYSWTFFVKCLPNLKNSNYPCKILNLNLSIWKFHCFKIHLVFPIGKNSRRPRLQ